MSSYLKFRTARTLRKIKRNAHTLRLWTSNYLNRHVYGAWRRLGPARNMFVAWVALAIICLAGVVQGIGRLDQFYMTTKPMMGGIYSEGLTGNVSVVNPILPGKAAEDDVTSLVFNGLTKLDQERQIKPDLAESWQPASDLKSYTFHLRKNVYWHDGVKFDAYDVAFTISAIQNPDTRSPLAANWTGVKYEVINDTTIKIILPTVYPRFLNNTTVGILPRHILESTKPSTLRISEFNQKPIGTGPFKLDPLTGQTDKIVLRANQAYFEGQPNFSEVHFVVYDKPADLIEGYARKQIAAISRIRSENANQAEKFDDLKINRLSLPAYVGLFLNLKSPGMADIHLRRALAEATDRGQIIEAGMHDEATPVYFPVSPSSANENLKKFKLAFDTNQAKVELNQAPGLSAIKAKPIKLVTLDDAEMAKIAELVKEQWGKIGINVQVVKATDVNDLQQRFIRARDYDVLLYGQNVGADADVYSFWHSSQISDPGLNLSSYKNAEADKLLESGRLAKDAKYRADKYVRFNQIWASDAPAILLYSPHYLYGQNRAIKGLTAKKIVQPSDRLLDINKWYIRSESVPVGHSR